MKTRTWSWFAMVVAVGLMSIPVSARGAFDVFRNGVEWDATYEGDVHPGSSTPSWAGFGGGGPASGSSDGAIWTQTTIASSFLYFETTDPSWTAAAPERMVEFRARVPVQTATDRAFDVFAVTPFGYWRVALSSNGVQLAGSVAIGSVTPIDNSSFHTYRLVLSELVTADKAKLYVDGALVSSSGLSAAGSSFGNLLTFGDRSTGGIGGTTELDFISWDLGVPEPSVCALLAAGGLMVLGKRRGRA